MKLKNMSLIPTEDILKWLGKYSNHFEVVEDNSMTVVLNTGNRPFVDDPRGILVCNPHDLQIANVDGFGGLAYPFGAVSIYVYPLEKVKWNGRSSYLYENRFLHEILHHFNKPCHEIDKWVSNSPLKVRIMWFLGGRNVESHLGSKCARMFYTHLLDDVNETEFDETYRVPERVFVGCLE
jgi:hypothetical protein